ncbi:unnamed protein product [Soboliphyme baturini]|uniref:Importin N-terminal domain-containing protein n=1 Tax=Soboliphyme baturini TaxID=241478 RepID=A0A183IFG5_9BILA|nr:unnamed protein product [Soboliphyme baturini]
MRTGAMSALSSMEPNENNMRVFSNYLQQTLSPDDQIRKPAESFLVSVEHNEGFSRLVISVILSPDFSVEVKMAGAITLKNFVRHNWNLTKDDVHYISDTDRAYIKEQILGLMIIAAPNIKRQVAEALAVIGKSDFPDRWPCLVGDFVSYLTSGDFDVIQSVLQTAHSLFKHYRSDAKSNELWAEIKYVLDNFASPLTELFKLTVTYVIDMISSPTRTPENSKTAKAAIASLTLMAKIFYSLNIQDLPEFFEDNINVWMSNFLTLLKADFSPLVSPNEDVVENLRSQICNNIGMYAQRYEEEFSPYLSSFVEVVWNMLLNTGREVKYDLLVANAVSFLASVCERERYKGLFENNETLAYICERIIVPNMELRQCDLDIYQDNPEEYVQKDIEGFDASARRRSASDFVRILCKYFEPSVIHLCSTYINQLFTEYAVNPMQNWQRKDAAIHLVMSLISRGQTAKYGATKTTELVNIAEFFNNHVKPELESETDLCMLKMDALKYVVTFRHQLPKEELQKCLPVFIKLLKSADVGVRSYAAHLLECVLTMKDLKGKLSSQFVVDRSRFVTG